MINNINITELTIHRCFTSTCQLSFQPSLFVPRPFLTSTVFRVLDENRDGCVTIDEFVYSCALTTLKMVTSWSLWCQTMGLNFFGENWVVVWNILLCSSRKLGKWANLTSIFEMGWFFHHQIEQFPLRYSKCIPNAPCMVYLPTFTINFSQM